MAHDRLCDVLPAEVIDAALACGEDVESALAMCREFGRRLPLPGGGHTARRWAVLSGVGRASLTAARVFEAHTDALAILAESGQDIRADDRTWGVFAAEAPDVRLDAHSSGAGVRLTGTKPWCSVAGELDAALVTAHRGGDRGLFAVDLRGADVSVAASDRWVARGLRAVTSGPVTFDATPAIAVGEPGWYLRRPGFAWGGLGVAACWHGGALGVADALTAAVRTRSRELDTYHVGAVDVALHASANALSVAADLIDSGSVEAPDVLALRTRAIVAHTVETVLRHVGHALGPAPLSFDAEHAARVADLSLYVRQHHGERDLAALGARIVEQGA